jgi:hypothetical protein
MDFEGAAGRIWWPEATRLEDPLDTSTGIWTPKSSGKRDARRGTNRKNGRFRWAVEGFWGLQTGYGVGKCPSR